MAFLSPWFLLGLFAVAGPVVAHLRRLRVQNRVRFSAVDFIEVRPPRTAARRWEHLALLAVRATALALLSLAFARPYFTSLKPQDSLAPSMSKRRMVLLDRSASMQRGGVFVEALTKVGELAGAVTESDELELVAFDQKNTVILSAEVWQQTARGERAALVEGLLRGIKAGWRKARLDDALRYAVERHAAGSGRVQTEVTIVSDFQEGTSLAGVQGIVWPQDFTIRLVRVGSAISDNRSNAVGMHWLAPDGIEGNSEAPFRVQLSAADGFRGDRVKMRMESATTAEWFASVHAGRLSTVSVPFPLVDHAYIRAGEIDDFSVGVWVARIPQAQVRVALCGAGRGANGMGSRYFIERALAALGSGRASLHQDSSLAADDDPAVNLWLLAGSADAKWTDRMRSALENGATGVAVIEAADDAKSLSALAGESVGVAEAALDGYAVLGSVDRAHPVFSAFSTPQFADFSGLRFWKYRKISLNQDSKAAVLARFDGGDPAVLEFPVGKGRLIVWASGWHSQDGQWVLSTRCVPFLSGCLEYSGGGRRPLLLGTPGESLELPVETRVLKRSDGLRIDVSDASACLEEPGVYFIEPSGGMVVVNVAREERLFDSIPVERLEALGLPVAKVDADGFDTQPTGLRSAQGLSNDAMAAREVESRQSWWRILLGAVIAALGIETFWSANLSSGRSRVV
jgi:hypothetical protein